MNANARTTSVAVLIMLGLALAAPVRAAETELVGRQTSWRLFLRMGPFVGRKDGTLAYGRESRPVDFAKAEFLKGWMAAHSPSPAEGWFRADFDDSNWGRYQTDELAEKTGGYGGGSEQAPSGTWGDRFHLRTCFGISDPAAAQDLTLALAYLLLCGVDLRDNDPFGPSPWCSGNSRRACGVFLRASHAHADGTHAGRSI